MKKLKVIRPLLCLALTLVLYAQVSTAVASDRLCRKIDGNDPKVCKCGTNLTSYSLMGIENFPLVTVCRYRKMDAYIFGQFTFEGSVELTGKITREDTASLGDTLFFHLGESLEKKLPGYLTEIRFGDEARKKFGAPRVVGNVSCWVADTTIILRKLFVQEGPGTDNDGSLAISYSVKHVGKFERCSQQ